MFYPQVTCVDSSESSIIEIMYLAYRPLLRCRKSWAGNRLVNLTCMNQPMHIQLWGLYDLLEYNPQMNVVRNII